MSDRGLLVDRQRQWGLPLNLDEHGVYAQLGCPVSGIVSNPLCAWDIDMRLHPDVRASTARGGLLVPAFRTKEPNRVVVLGVGQLEDLTPQDREALESASVQFSGQGQLRNAGRLYIPAAPTDWLDAPASGRNLAAVPYMMFAIALASIVQEGLV